MDKEDFLNTLRSVAMKDTSVDPEDWVENNPLWGHCAAVSVLAQDIYGGELIRGSLAKSPKYAHLRSHYWNRMPNGEEVDFTAEQYSDLTFLDLDGKAYKREQMLESQDTKRRYDLLKKRFIEHKSRLSM